MARWGAAFAANAEKQVAILAARPSTREAVFPTGMEEKRAEPVGICANATAVGQDAAGNLKKFPGEEGSSPE